VTPDQPERQQAGLARARLQQALRSALQARDAVAISALRSAHAAIDNAEAIAPPAARSGQPNQYIAGGVRGLRAAEARRRVLSEAEAEGIIRAEIADRQTAAALYERAGHADRAARLRGEADALAAVMSADPPPRADPPRRADPPPRADQA
jgi:hypothetical protein